MVKKTDLGSPSTASLDSFDNLRTLVSRMKETHAQNLPLFTTISRFVGIDVDPNYYMVNSPAQQSKQLDEFVDDPTSAISVNQAGDYLLGIMWGTGEKVFDLVPSKYVLEEVDPKVLEDYFGYITEEVLYHLNHEDAGLITAMKPYCYDQFSFGTSGIGIFPNKEFINGVADNAFICRGYGVDNLLIDEGKSGQVEYVGAPYQWKVNRIVGEFAMIDGEVASKAIKNLPMPIQEAYNSGDYNKQFNLLNVIYPRQDFDPRLKGKRGMRYQGVWYLDRPADNNVFHTEDFAVRPINICRAVKIRGQVYGRASGTMLISTIRSINFIVSTLVEILEKMADPSLGVGSNALFGDSVLDTSPHGLTIFNSAFLDGKGSPVFPIHDIGDPSEIIKFLIPYLNEKVTTGFKVDSLLDFSSAKNMSATESLQRYAIRGKSLSGMLTQQKNELLIPTVKRAISILDGMNCLGVDGKSKLGNTYKGTKNAKRIIPEAVSKVKAAGKPWFTIKFNNELEKLTRTEAVQNLVQILQTVTAIAALYPDIVDAIDWYKFLKDVNDNLDKNNQIMISATDFKNQVAAKAKARAAAMAAQAGQAGAQIQKDTSSAHKNMADAQATRKDAGLPQQPQ